MCAPLRISDLLSEAIARPAVATDAQGAASTSTTIAVMVNAASVQVYCIYADHLDTPRMITNTAGAVVWQWDNVDPFGNNMADENPSGAGIFNFNLRFPGQYFDEETGLHYNYFRYYDPAIGRYVTSDPIGLAGGINTYAYVGGNPLSYTDPMGLARIMEPEHKSFNDAINWRKKYKALYDTNNSIREYIKKNCPDLLSKFDNWDVYPDPHMDDMFRRERATAAHTDYFSSGSNTQFNYDFFNLGPRDPSQANIFVHEFRHTMKENADLYRPGDSFRDPKDAPGETDANAWADNFWKKKCGCH